MKSGVKPPKFDVIPEVGDNEDGKDLLSVKESAPLLVSSPMFPSPVEIPVPELPARKRSKHWVGNSHGAIRHSVILLHIYSIYIYM